MKKVIVAIVLSAMSNATFANSEYSNYQSCMAPKQSYKVMRHMNVRTINRLKGLETALAILSVVSLTAVYYTTAATENKSLAPYSIPVGLAVGSFVIGGISNK